jgi:hypothetical protein
MPSPIQTALASAADRMLPRILTQVCRDPSHPAYGCFDRNWWHYKIRDFPSIIMQQGGYTLWEAASGTDHPQQHSLRDLAAAACLFWNKRAIRHGAFEEYYPWEEGYPPLAFGTLAVAKLAGQGATNQADLEEGLRIATRQLLNRFESEAANQQMAGLAALAVLRQLQPALVPAHAYEHLLARTLALQTTEGWFLEYGGPDIGYLSVTIDCLWDIHDHQPDDRVKQSLLSACRFISQITALGSVHVGLHNARNTDYLVPYGLVRAARELAPDWPEGQITVDAIFRGASEPGHFLHATDDRYLCHYIGHSVIRARNYLSQASEILHPSSKVEDPSHLPTFPASRHFPLSSHYLFPADDDRSFGALVTPKKGGIFSLQSGGEQASDYGWVIQDPDSQHITHWWSDEWQWREEDAGTLAIEGNFYVHRETESSPFKHLVLRVMSLLLGRSIIARLKSRLIFRRPRSPYRFKRVISVGKDAVCVRDGIMGLTNFSALRRAPRPSKRHVASADSFHPEDLTLLKGFTREETSITAAAGIMIETKYHRTNQ